MARRSRLSLLLGAAICSGYPVIASGQDGGVKLGELKDLTVWVNKMPPGPFVLRARGEVTAPTPCHDAVADYDGDDKSNPPVYRIRVKLIQRPGACIQKPFDTPFEYVQQNYMGNHQKMDIATDKDSKIIAIDISQ